MRADDKVDVSRETLDRLEEYSNLVRKWNAQINLISRNSADDMWRRHIFDSVQIHELAPHPVAHWADLGAGGGFPGIVVAILAVETGSPEKTTLVESDQRKCAFLRTCVRELGLNCDVRAERIENIAPLDADVISARALADLSFLLEHAERHLRPGGAAIFPKGATWRNELNNAQAAWHFRYRADTSKTEPGSAILTFEGVARV